MDPSNLEFLDLSELDQSERSELLCSLQGDNHSVVLPWAHPDPQTPNLKSGLTLNVSQKNHDCNGYSDIKETGNKSWASLFSSSSNGTQSDAKVIKEVKNELSQAKFPKAGKLIDPDCYRMGEFLEEYEIDGKTISLQPRGLINQSNYCYINSILQALNACPPFYNLLYGLGQIIKSNEKRKPTPVIDALCKFIKEFQHLPENQRVGRKSDKAKKESFTSINSDMPFEPFWVYKLLTGFKTDLIEGRQEDAEEFLGFLLNGLNDEMLELIKMVKENKNDHQINEIESKLDEGEEREWQVMGPKNKGSVTRKTDFEKTPISAIFGGRLKSKIMRTGDHVTENIQPFFTLPLNIETVGTVKEALEALMAKNQLEGVFSSKTNQQVEAWQQVMLDELPVVLILHLKCFDFQLDGCAKILKALEFPIDLKIDSKLMSCKNCTAKEKQYKLFAVVYHDGKDATKGHYITDAFHVGYNCWLRYDDAAVRQVQEEGVLKPSGNRIPYLLFYRRCDSIRR